MDTHCRSCCALFFFNDTATSEIYTLSLHDALPILGIDAIGFDPPVAKMFERKKFWEAHRVMRERDRKSTRLNSSHEWTSYAVFCLKKKSRAYAACSSNPPPMPPRSACRSSRDGLDD